MLCWNKLPKPLFGGRSTVYHQCRCDYCQSHDDLELYSQFINEQVLIDFSLTVKAATLIFKSGRGSAISSAKQGKSSFIYNLVKSL